jgi:hypothetical protein
VLQKSGLPYFVTVMAWEKRSGNRYYYQSERAEDGRVVKKYIGAGEIAELIAHADDTRRRAREARWAQEQEALERMQALAAPVLEIDEVTDVLARAHLVAGGFHTHKGAWRRGRST